MFSKMSGKCQGILKFPVCITNDEEQKVARAVFLTFWL